MIYYIDMILRYGIYSFLAVFLLLILKEFIKYRKYIKLEHMLAIVGGVRKKKAVVFQWMALAMAASLILVNLKSQLYSNATIALNYQNASKGVNPDGSRYNMSEILSDEILEEAIQIGALEHVEVSDLKKSLSIVPNVQGTTESESDYHISTEFTLSYKGLKKTAHLNGTMVLQSVMQAYREWFYKKYIDGFHLLDLNFDELKQYDYLEICDYLDTKAQNIEFYMKSYEQRDAGFRQEGNENTFTTLALASWQFRDVALEKLRSYIMENGLSKNKDSYIGKLNYESKLAQFDYDKASQAHGLRLDAIKMYENDMARIVLVPSYDKNDEFYMSRTKIGIDDFSREADGYANQMTGLAYTVSENSLVAQKLGVSMANELYTVQADQMISELKEELINLSVSAKQLVQGSQKKEMNEGFTFLMVNEGTWYWLTVAKLFFASTFLFAGFCFRKAMHRFYKKIMVGKGEGIRK